MDMDCNTTGNGWCSAGICRCEMGWAPSVLCRERPDDHLELMVGSQTVLCGLSIGLALFAIYRGVTLISPSARTVCWMLLASCVCHGVNAIDPGHWQLLPYEVAKTFFALTITFQFLAGALYCRGFIAIQAKLDTRAERFLKHFTRLLPLLCAIMLLPLIFLIPQMPIWRHRFQTIAKVCTGTCLAVLLIMLGWHIPHSLQTMASTAVKSSRNAAQINYYRATRGLMFTARVIGFLSLTTLIFIIVVTVLTNTGHRINLTTHVLTELIPRISSLACTFLFLYSLKGSNSATPDDQLSSPPPLPNASTNQYYQFNGPAYYAPAGGESRGGASSALLAREAHVRLQRPILLAGPAQAWLQPGSKSPLSQGRCSPSPQG